MFLNLCKLSKSLLFPCKFVLLSAYCKQINVLCNLIWSPLETSLLKQFALLCSALLCSAWEATALWQGVTWVCQRNALSRWHEKSMGFVGKTSARAGCGSPWGLSQYPTGHQKTIPDTGGPWERETFSSAGLCKVNSQRKPSSLHQAITCFALHTLAEPSGSQAHLKEPHWSAF